MRLGRVRTRRLMPGSRLAVLRRRPSRDQGWRRHIVVTSFHQARPDVLKVHSRGDRQAPLTGVSATRSPDRPNPIGLHRVTVRKMIGNRYRIGAIEAIDGTSVVDIKSVLQRSDHSRRILTGARRNGAGILDKEGSTGRLL